MKILPINRGHSTTSCAESCRFPVPIWRRKIVWIKDFGTGGDLEHHGLHWPSV